MASKEELKELLRKENILDVLNKHHSIDELYSFLDIINDDDRYYDGELVLNNFPKTKEYDNVKINFLNKYSSKISRYDISEIIRLIYDDKDKLQVLKKYRSSFIPDLITNVINSLRSDKLRKEQFKKNISLYDDIQFSDYLGNIKDDKLRTEELLLYIDKYPNFNICWFTDTFKKEEDKIKAFDEYYDDTKRKYIAQFIHSLKNVDNIISVIHKYRDKIDLKDISYLFLYTDNDILKFINEFGQEISSSLFVDLLRKVKNKDKTIEILDKYCYKIPPYYLFDIIRGLGDSNTLLEFYDRYIDYLDYHEFRSLLIYLPEDKTKAAFAKYVGRYPESLIIIWHTCRHNSIKGLSCEYLFDNYIDLFSMLDLADILDTLVNDDEKSIELVYELLSKTNDINTIRKIYNAVACVDPKYFLENFYNDNRIFTDKDRKLLNRLSNNNPYFFSTFNFSLLEVPVLRNNRFFLPKLAKYPKTAQRIVSLYHKKPKLISLLLLLIKKIYSYDIYYDFATDKLIDAFFDSNNSFLENIVLGTLTEDDKIVLIYKIINNNKKDKGIYDVDVNNNDDLKEYRDNLNNQINESYDKCTTIDDKKNHLLNKLYGISLEKASKIVNTYGYSVDKFSNESSLEYIKTIRSIINEDNINKLDSYYNYPSLNLEERYLMEYEFKKEYNRSIRNDLYKVENSEQVHTFFYDGVAIPMYCPTGEFKLLVNSLSAYVNKSEISDYYEFWNQNTNVKNHGICCSIISNRNIFQTAPVNDVLIGFADFSDSTIQLGNSSDIGSTNDEFALRASVDTKFMTADDYIDNTRWSHNELVLERAELRKNFNNLNLKPSYVIVYDTFNEEQFRKSLKASKELKIPVVYIDTKAIIKRENDIVEDYFKQISEYFDLNTFNLFFNRYMNNYYGTRRNNESMCKPYFSEELFLKELTLIIKKIYYDFMTGSITKEEIINNYNGINYILQKEISKTGQSKSKDFINLKPFVETIENYIGTINETRKFK